MKWQDESPWKLTWADTDFWSKEMGERNPVWDALTANVRDKRKKVIVVSTAYGYNSFFEKWRDDA